MILWPLLGEMDCYWKVSLKTHQGYLFIYLSIRFFWGGGGGGGGDEKSLKNFWQKHETRNTLSASKKKAVLSANLFSSL